MSRVLEMVRLRCWPRVAALALMTIGVAACSSDMTRFNEGPFAANRPETTGSIAQGQVGPAGRVDSQPLAPQAAQAQPKPIKLAAAGPVAPAGSKGAPDGSGSVVRKPGA